MIRKRSFSNTKMSEVSKMDRLDKVIGYLKSNTTSEDPMEINLFNWHVIVLNMQISTQDVVLRTGQQGNYLMGY